LGSTTGFTGSSENKVKQQILILIELIKLSKNKNTVEQEGKKLHLKLTPMCAIRLAGDSLRKVVTWLLLRHFSMDAKCWGSPSFLINL